MSKRLAIFFLVAFAALAVAIASGAASASSGASAKKVNIIPIVMADPGCHWFQVNGKNKLKVVVKGKTAFRNLDEAALIFNAKINGKRFHRLVKVGKMITIAKRGVYHITMVDQAPDDNHLTLVVT